MRSSTPVQLHLSRIPTAEVQISEFRLYTMELSRKPTPAEIRAAAGKTVRDVIAPGLEVLFCGINPGLYSAAVQHHFARPGNHFWPALHQGGFTDRLLSPFEERELVQFGCGITNIARRATAGAEELSKAELTRGALRLERKVLQYRPRFVAILGVSAYCSAFHRPRARLGRQQERVGNSTLWILPNPSGLNAHYPLNDLTRLFRQLRLAVTKRS